MQGDANASRSRRLTFSGWTPKRWATTLRPGRCPSLSASKWAWAGQPRRSAAVSVPTYENRAPSKPDGCRAPGAVFPGALKIAAGPAPSASPPTIGADANRGPGSENNTIVIKSERDNILPRGRATISISSACPPATTSQTADEPHNVRKNRFGCRLAARLVCTSVIHCRRTNRQTPLA